MKPGVVLRQAQDERASRPPDERAPRPPLPTFLRWPSLVAIAVVLVAWRVVDGDLALLVSKDAWGAMADFARGFWPPAHDAELLSLLARPLLETLAIAFLGMTVALALALPLSVLATDPALLVAGGERPSAARRVAWMAARGLLNLMRSIPEIVWALVFVRAVGMGPTAGVLAIGIGYGGIVGKVFAETFESTPRGPARALAAAGARPTGAFLFGVLPGALPLLSSYTLYRLDCALRASAVLGLVGAGGIGLQLELSIKMFAWNEVAAMVLGLFALVAALDLASGRLRRRINASRGLLPAGRRGAAVRLAVPVAWLFLAAGAVAFLRLPLGELFSMETPRSAWAFVASTWPPDVSPAFLRQLGPAVLETLAVSVVGIAIAVALGLPLALLAARRGPSAALARVLLALGRTLPELLWALLVIFAVGLGPFAGALALGLHTAGVLGRLHAEALEEVPQGPVLALRAMGAPALSAEAFAAWPQAFPQLAAYTLYRWEVAIRASAVLGVVGAGGLGQLLHVSLSLFHHHRTATLVLAIVLLVTAVDLFSGWLRARILAGRPLVAAAVPLEAT